jgi:hypothetical protein
MMVAAATAADLAALLGELDALVIERILATGATTDEVAEAMTSIMDEDDGAEGAHAPSSPRVAEVRAVLEELVLDETEAALGEVERAP